MSYFPNPDPPVAPTVFVPVPPLAPLAGPYKALAALFPELLFDDGDAPSTTTVLDDPEVHTPTLPGVPTPLEPVAPVPPFATNRFVPNVVEPPEFAVGAVAVLTPATLAPPEAITTE
jgi:hypothetical protein